LTEFLQFLQSSIAPWMVDLLRCAGQLQEAEDVINMMPFEPQVLLHCHIAFRIHCSIFRCTTVRKEKPLVSRADSATLYSTLNCQEAVLFKMCKESYVVCEL
jgi:hypothetical protein